MKHPCAWCGERPVVYRGTEYCSYSCWASSLRTTSGVLEPEEVSPKVEFTNAQLDLFENLKHTPSSIGTSSNGRATDSGSVYQGSNPCVPANLPMSLSD